MPRDGWKSVSLPSSLVEKVDEEIEEHPSNWKSRADFVTYVIRRYLEVLETPVILK